MTERKYGWIPDIPDHRDHMFAAAPIDASTLPPAVDLREWCPAVMDQGQIGSCTANATTGAIRYNRIKTGKPDVALARLQLYYDSRALEHTTKSDSGAMIRDVVKSANKKGVAPESLWAYSNPFTKKPTTAVYKAALDEQVLRYESVNVDVNSIKAAVASGFPVVFGISVFKSFESNEVAKTGIVPMPMDEEPALGGHCMYIVGYGQKPGYFTVRNSWGTSWGDKGDCYIPENYIGNRKLGDDYWVIKSVE